MALTYLQFHALFLLPPLAILAASATRRRQSDWRIDAVGFAIVAALALVYTTPWDSYLIGRGVWWYGEGRVAGRLFRIPAGEFLFFLLQPALTALWLAHLPRGDGAAAADTTTNGKGGVDGAAGAADGLTTDGGRAAGARMTWSDRGLGAAAGVAVGLIGLAMVDGRATFYLGAILLWAGPVLALQWAVGWRWLVSAGTRGRVAAGVLGPTLYLCAVDRIAIADGIWIVGAEFTTGLTIAGLPVEEAAFFLVTNCFVVQGLVLFRRVVERWR